METYFYYGIRTKSKKPCRYKAFKDLYFWLLESSRFFLLPIEYKKLKKHSQSQWLGFKVQDSFIAIKLLFYRRKLALIRPITYEILLFLDCSFLIGQGTHILCANKLLFFVLMRELNILECVFLDYWGCGLLYISLQTRVKKAKCKRREVAEIVFVKTPFE